MEYAAVADRVGGTPFISRANARFLYQFIVDNEIEQVLELGIAHGTSTCFIAAALERKGRGRVTAVDLEEVEFVPSAEQQLAACGLAHRAEIHRMKTGYNWFLHDAIAEATSDGRCEPRYELCILDGAKNWTLDSSAFFLAEKLLREGGWFIFDDYDWTYAEADRKREATDGVAHRSLSEPERAVPHVREIFELLVKQHPNFGEFVRRGTWAMARKVRADAKRYRVVGSITPAGAIEAVMRRFCRRRHGSD